MSRTVRASVICLLIAAACGDGGGGATTESTATAPPTATAPSTTTAAATTTAADPADPLVGIGEVELIDEGYIFTEGPQWLKDQGILVFTDIEAGSSRPRG